MKSIKKMQKWMIKKNRKINLHNALKIERLFEKDREIIWKVDKLFEKHKKLFRKLIEI